MNAVIDTMLKRKSIRAYQQEEIAPQVKAQILQATLRAPTAGNMMLYSILDVTDQGLKDKLAKTCDNQPFIAKAPMVWVFLADYQRWQDYFVACGVEEICAENKQPMRTPAEGDLFLACCDALIAAQNAVIAAESFGIGSCYIGDVMEQYETHRELFNLPRYVFPICMVCFGYPTEQQTNRVQSTRFDEKFVVFENRYRRLDGTEFEEMFRPRHAQIFNGRESIEGSVNVGQVMYRRKFSADFSLEMTRSVRAMLAEWKNE
jgi:FMN reductase (NADPH)/FMN reductase [NAD(P)H]